MPKIRVAGKLVDAEMPQKRCPIRRCKGHLRFVRHLHVEGEIHWRIECSRQSNHNFSYYVWSGDWEDLERVS